MLGNEKVGVNGQIGFVGNDYRIVKGAAYKYRTTRTFSHLRPRGSKIVCSNSLPKSPRLRMGRKITDGNDQHANGRKKRFCFHRISGSVLL